MSVSIKKTGQLLSGLILASLTLSVQAVEFSYSGFGSLTAGRVLSGKEQGESGLAFDGHQGAGYMADYNAVGVYDKDWSIRPESLLGLQGTLSLNEKIELTGQVLGRGIESPELDVDWLYAGYRFAPGWKAQVGRKRLPIYYYSDYFEVGYAYPWVRAPEIAYSFQISRYNGANVSYEGYWKDWDFSANFYMGEEKDNNNKLMRFFLQEKVKEHWVNIRGAHVSLEREWLDVRLSWMRTNLDRTTESGARTTGEQIMKGIAVNLHLGNFSLLTEIMRTKRPSLNAHMKNNAYSLTYRAGDFTPYLMYNDFLSDYITEDHHTVTAGVRWDFMPKLALKAQLDRYSEEGKGPGLLGADADTFTLSLDFTF